MIGTGWTGQDAVFLVVVSARANVLVLDQPNVLRADVEAPLVRRGVEITAVGTGPLADGAHVGHVVRRAGCSRADSREASRASFKHGMTCTGGWSEVPPTPRYSEARHLGLERSRKRSHGHGHCRDKLKIRHHRSQSNSRYLAISPLLLSQSPSLLYIIYNILYIIYNI